MPRPKSPLISRESAVRAALEVIDQDGLDAFNLGRVARRLGVAAPSLYHHFRDKNEILTEVARLILLQADEPSCLPADDWREALISLAVSARRSILRHPKAAPLLLLHPPRHIALQAYERSLRLFEKKGVPKELHMAIVNGMDNIVFGAALLTASARAQGIDAFPIFAPSSFPSLTNAIKANTLDEEDIFVRIARSFLDGIYPAP